MSAPGDRDGHEGEVVEHDVSAQGRDARADRDGVADSLGVRDDDRRAELWRRLRAAQDGGFEGAAGRIADRALAHAVMTKVTRVPHIRLSRAWIAAGAVGLLALATVLLALRPARLRFEAASGAEGLVGQTVVAEATTELPLRFSDGSTITFQPGASGTVERLSGTGADVELRAGALEAHVVHANGTRWVVRAGVFRVRVTGTRFLVSWSPAHTTFAVTLREGSVIVDGGVLGAGVMLRAGQRLRVDLIAGTIRTEPIGAAPHDLSAEMPAGAPGTNVPLREREPAPEGGSPAAEASAARLPTRTPSDHEARGHERPVGDWRALAEAGAYTNALRAAERAGLATLRERLDPEGLLALGDVARLGGDPQTARLVFERLVARFPSDARAADAVFSLGRLAFEAQRPAVALGWFDRYVTRWPDGPLAEQAFGRRLESAQAARDRRRALAAAYDYLERAPQGPYADRARAVIAEVNAGAIEEGR